jgi:hypothetical protein
VAANGKGARKKVQEKLKKIWNHNSLEKKTRKDSSESGFDFDFEIYFDFDFVLKDSSDVFLFWRTSERCFLKIIVDFFR